MSRAAKTPMTAAEYAQLDMTVEGLEARRASAQPQASTPAEAMSSQPPTAAELENPAASRQETSPLAGLDLDADFLPARAGAPAKRRSGPRPTPVSGNSGQLYAKAYSASMTGSNTASLIGEGNHGNSDELNALLESSAQLGNGERMRVQVLAQVEPGWGLARRSELDARDQGVPHLSSGQKWFARLQWLYRLLVDSNAGASKAQPARPARKSREEREFFSLADAKLKSKVHYRADVRVAVFGDAEDARRLDATLTSAIEHGFDAYMTPYQGLAWEECNPRLVTSGHLSRAGRLKGDRQLVLAPDELAAVARAHDGNVRPANVHVKYSSLLPLRPERIDEVKDPANPEAGLSPFALVGRDSDEEAIVGLQIDRLDSHMFIQGRAGTGKSNSIVWLAHALARNGEAIVMIDPHGKLAADTVKILSVYDRHRLEDIVYIDLSDPTSAPAINPLDVRDERNHSAAVQGVLETLSAHFGIGENQPRAVLYLSMALNAMTEANLHIKDKSAKLTLLQVNDFFKDPEFRWTVCQFSTNKDVRETFEPEVGEWDQMSEKDQFSYHNPITSKLTRLGSGIFQSIFASSENRLDFAELVAQKKIIILNLARMNDASSREMGEFIGGLVLPALQSGIGKFKREEDPVSGENIGGDGVYIIVDEAPVVFKEPKLPANWLAENRKAGCGLIFAAQYSGQLDPELEDAAMANTSTKLSFALDAVQSRRLAASMSTGKVQVTGQDIGSLENFQVIAQVKESLPDGSMRSSPAYAAWALKPIEAFDESLKGVTSQQRRVRDQWVRTTMEAVRENTRLLVENPVSLMSKRFALTQGIGPTRRVMTQHSIDVLRKTWDDMHPVSTPEQAQEVVVEAEGNFSGWHDAPVSVQAPPLTAPGYGFAEEDDDE